MHGARGRDARGCFSTFRGSRPGRGRDPIRRGTGLGWQCGTFLVERNQAGPRRGRGKLGGGVPCGVHRSNHVGRCGWVWHRRVGELATALGLRGCLLGDQKLWRPCHDSTSGGRVIASMVRLSDRQNRVFVAAPTSQRARGSSGGRRRRCSRVRPRRWCLVERNPAAGSARSRRD